MEECKNSTSDSDDQVTKNANLFFVIRKKEHTISEESKCKELEKCLNEGSNINAVDNNDNGNTILHIAVKKNYTKIIKFLIDKGADTDIANSKGKIPLSIAQDHYQNLVKLLSKSDLKKKFKEGESLSKENISKKQELTNASAISTSPISRKVDNLRKQPFKFTQSVESKLNQLKLLILFLKRGLENEYRFCFTSDANEEEINNIIFQYVKKDDKGNIIRDTNEYCVFYINLKNDENEKVGYHELLSDNIDDEFSLQKYFNYYCMIKQKFECDAGVLKEFVIYTNINLNDDELKQFGIESKMITDPNDFYNIKAEIKTSSYKLLVTDQHELYKKLKDTSAITELARTLKIDNIKSCGKELQLKTFPHAHTFDIEVTEFFEKLIFVIPQVKEVKLEKAIKDEVGEVFNLIDAEFSDNSNKIISWIKAKVSKNPMLKFNSVKDGFDFLNAMEEKIINLKLDSLTMKHSTEIYKLGITFSRESIDHLKLREFLVNRTNEQIYCIISEQFTLTEIKLFQVLFSISKYKRDNDYTFLHLSSLLHFQTHVAKIWNSIKNLLIIECRDDESLKKKYKFLKKLSDQSSKFINSDSTTNICKKIIIIAKQNNLFSNMLKENPKLAEKYQETEDNSNNLTNLTKKSQKKLFKETKIVLQNYEISLRTILQEGSIESMKLNSDMLMQLINGQKIKIGSESACFGIYNKDLYVNRSFNHQIEIKSMIFNKMLESEACMLAVSNFNAIWFKLEPKEICDFDDLDDLANDHIQVVILKPQDPEDQYRKLRSQFPKRNVHWLKNEFDKFIWVQPCNSEPKLVQYKPINEYECETDKLDFDVNLLMYSNQIQRYEFYSTNVQMYDSNISIKNVSEEALLLHRDSAFKALIISDTAGMGKSTIALSLAQRFKENCLEPVWVIKINLNNYKRMFKNLKDMDFKNVDEHILIKFLKGSLKSHATTSLENNFEKIIFESCFKKKSKIKLALIFEDFDQVSADDKETVGDMLNALQKTYIGMLIVTTHPNMRYYLEKKLEANSYSLDPISKNDQVKYLAKFWFHLFNLSNIQNEEVHCRLDTYSRAVIERFIESLECKENVFALTPLHLNMLAEVFLQNRDGIQNEWQGCKEFLDSKIEKMPKLPKKIDFMFLYEQYLEIKMYENQHVPYTKQYYNKLKVKYGLLGLNSLGLNILLSEQEIQEQIDFMKEIENDNKNKGIIDQIVDNIPHFVHSAIAEYFSSLLLVERMFNDFVKILQHINNIISTASPVFISCLINMLETKQSEFESALNGKTLLNLVIEKGYLDLCRAILETGYENYPKRDILDKTPLHYAAEYGHTDIVRYLLYYNNDIFEKHILENGSFKNKAYVKSKIVNFVNTKDNADNTAVYYAAKQNNMTSVCDILLKGADIHTLKEFTREVTIFVAKMMSRKYADQYHNLTPIEEPLLMQDPTAVSKYSEDYEYPRLLSRLIVHGRYRVIQALINSIGDIEKRKRLLNATDNRVPPLDRVNTSDEISDDDRLETTKYLVENGSTAVQGGEDHNKWILFYSAIHDHVKTYEYFLNKNKIDCTWLYTCFYRAAEKHKLNIIKHFLENYMKYITYKGNTPLHAGIESQSRLSIIKLICKSGNFINVSNDEGDTPLMLAMKNDKLNVIKFLIDSGAEIKTHSEYMRNKIDYIKNPVDFNLNFIDHTGLPLLHRAIQSYDIAWSRFIIQEGANVNSKDKSGRTPLHWAVSQNAELVELLLQSGAIYDANDRQGIKPRDLISHENFIYKHEMLKIIWLLDVLHNLFHCEDLMKELKKWLLSGEWGPYFSGYPDAYDPRNPTRFILNSRNAESATLLHVASNLNDDEAIKELFMFIDGYSHINKNELINAKDSEGNTALHIAALRGHDKVMTILLDEGAFYNDKNNQGKTPLDLADIHGPSHDVSKILKLTENLFEALKKHNLTQVKNYINEGAISNAKDVGGSSHFHLALASSNVIQIYLKNKW